MTRKLRMIALLFAAGGCGGTDARLGPTDPTDPESIYWALDISHRTAQMSVTPPYNTLQIVATPRTISGAVWSPPPGHEADTGVTTYVSFDPSATVSSTGLVTVIANGQATIVARRQIGEVTRSDTLVISALAFFPPQVIDSIRARSDSAKRAMSATSTGSTSFTVRSYGPTGQIFFTPIIRVHSSDPSVVQFTNARSGSATLRKPGKAKITITTTAFGRALVDTFTFTVGNPITANFTVVPTGITDGVQRTMGPGGTVTWVNNSRQNIEVIFDDPSVALAQFPPANATNSGNITAFTPTLDPTPTNPFPLTSQRTRRFTAPGTYGFTLQPSGIRGSIVIKPS